MRRLGRLKALAAIVAVGGCLAMTQVAIGQAPLPSHTVPNSPGSITYPARGLSTPPPVFQRLNEQQLQVLWQDAGNAYGIPWQILASINRIESNFGTNMGPSSAGAVGWMQFIPSTWDRWGMDANGDGIADPWDPEDGIYSAARYLAAAGGQTDLRKAIFAYNHANWYVNDVIELAQSIGATGSFEIPQQSTTPGVPSTPSTVLQVDGLPERRAATQEEIVETKARVAELKDEIASLRNQRAAIESTAGDAGITQERFAKIESDISSMDARETELKTELGETREGLEGSIGRLASLEQEADATTFWRPLDTVVVSSAPDGRVAPVILPAGVPLSLIGRPGHGTHNQSDWQSGNAVDIAAPPGTPLVAIEDGVITRVSGQDASQGTRVTATGKKIYGYGVTLAGTTDTYYYAHVNEVVVFPGQQVKAGQVIAAISPWPGGAPHLHLGVRNGDPALAAGAPRITSVEPATPKRVAKRATPAQPVFEVVDESDDVVTFVKGS